MRGERGKCLGRLTGMPEAKGGGRSILVDRPTFFLVIDYASDEAAFAQTPFQLSCASDENYWDQKHVRKCFRRSRGRTGQGAGHQYFGGITGVETRETG